MPLGEKMFQAMNKTRVPTLLNVAVTAPYGHADAYQTLEEVVNHYNSPRRAINRLFAAQGNQAFVDGVAPFCQLPQVVDLMQKTIKAAKTSILTPTPIT
jgi:hypothetical protein